MVAGADHAAMGAAYLPGRGRTRQPGPLPAATEVSLRYAARRVRSAVWPAPQLPPRGPWQAYLTEVEPAVASEVRLHRFARPPVLAPATTAGERMLVWIDGDGPAAERTADSISRSTTAPTAIVN